MAQPVPQELSYLVAVNVEYSVLICIGNTCYCAVSPAGLTAHVRRKHKVSKRVWKQVEQYVEECAFKEYNYASIQLPANGLAPQPIISVVDGFQCQHCLYKTTDYSNIRKHANKTHNKQRAKDEELFQAVRLQSWFQHGKERYWVVDEGQQIAQERQVRQAAIRDIGEESNSEADTSNSSSSDSEGSQDSSLSNSLDDIVKDIEGWKADTHKRLLEALKKVPAAEIDAWLHFTGWNKVLGQSEHDLVKTHQFARPPDPDEPELERVLRAWRRILERCLDTLAATDQKDALKWWGSPKNEAASQRPFELPQNSQTVETYSAIWERFICYMMRTAPVERWEDKTGMLMLPKNVT
jgi:Orsellinic acid/F9775 biosynthesis cluster protein D